ncbi:class I SAM-dependent methyltransferase [Lentzea flaviverrucosa]|uniref:Tellurite resistance protein TehB n=1 Tax=Lentzea flaviverrucosa TaxID=200379 RepID=A0A1H9XX15_9PSEU|nr:methyltransferase domain-containing protein [Lentzea flaviverrucosa]RDI17422.1 tellurite resistance protein TehB [Lentzea flaviverrucosa]SES50710.1 Tellurite resistance protein TehB [Lentzea flaviverrucosa]
MVGRRAYDFMYRTWAPWEGEARPELVDLVTSGRIAPGRAIDLGCGSGANSIFLAEHGFDVTGVDHSPVGLAKARRATPPSLSVGWLPGDLTATSIPRGSETAAELRLFGTSFEIERLAEPPRGSGSRAS